MYSLIQQIFWYHLLLLFQAVQAKVMSEKKSTELLNSEFKFDLCYHSLVYLEKCYASSRPGKCALEVHKSTTVLTVPHKKEHF